MATRYCVLPERLYEDGAITQNKTALFFIELYRKRKWLPGPPCLMQLTNKR